MFTEKTQQTSGPFVSPITNPRIDRVVYDNISGVIEIVAGTEAGSPVVPLIPDEKSPICQVALTVGMTAITNALITDERIGGAPSSIIVKDRVTADVTRVSSAAELDLYVYNVPGGLLGTNKSLDVRAFIKELDLPDSDSITLRVKYGATTMASFLFVAGAPGVVNGFGKILIELFADGATNAQIGLYHRIGNRQRRRGGFFRGEVRHGVDRFDGRAGFEDH